MKMMNLRGLSSLSKLNWPVLLVLMLVWLTVMAGLRPLMLPDEGRYVGVAWQMMKSGNFAVPLLDGMPFFHKPPLFYWLTALSMDAFGVSEWSARLASVFGASTAAASMYLFVRRYLGSMTAVLTLLILLTQPFFFAGAQFANLDMLVAGMISGSIVTAADAVLRAEAGEACRRQLLMAYAFAALGLLTKGLIGFVLPGGVLVLWLLGTRRWRGFSTLLWWPGIAVFLLLGLPWFVLMQHRYPGFFDYFVIYHHFKRFAQTGFNNQHPFWFYVPVLLGLTLPWSLWLWPALRGKKTPIDRRQRDIRRLMGCWLGLILVFFSLPASKLIGYILPVLPPLAFLLAAPMARRLETEPGGQVSRSIGWTLAIAAGICVASIIALAKHDGGSANPLAVKMRQEMSVDDAVVMLDRYQYDLPFYLRSGNPVWVVSDWKDPSLPQHDNWRKELYDAGLFDPAVAATNLVTADEFAARICQRPEAGSLWVWGDAVDVRHYPVLGASTLFAEHGSQRVWRLTPALRKLSCETPSSGSGQK